MRTKSLIIEPKTIESETAWSNSDIPPKHYPINKKTYPARGGWRWKSFKLKGNFNNFVLLFLCNKMKEQWKTILMLVDEDKKTAFAVVRYESHGNHPCIHVHTECYNAKDKVMEHWKVRIPNVVSVNSRVRKIYSEQIFEKDALSFFRAIRGDLFDASRKH